MIKFQQKKKNFMQLRQKVSQEKNRIADLENASKDLDRQLDSFLLTLPNLPGSDVPDGTSDRDNLEISK